MSVPNQQTQALDQLQREVNRVLEYTGRLFAAVSTSNQSSAVAQSGRLKQLLPLVSPNFHEALDMLDDELHFAKAVLRRDLAVCREKHGQPIQPTLITESAGVSTGQTDVVGQDITVIDSEPTKATTAEEDGSKDDATPTKSNASEATPEDTANGILNESGANLTPLDQGQMQGAQANEDADADPAESNLHLDTAAGLESLNNEEENPPSTGLSTNQDLESLFGTGGTTGPAGDEAQSTSEEGHNDNVNDNDNDNDNTIDFGTASAEAGDEQNAAQDFDFASFNASLGDAGAGQDGEDRNAGEDDGDNSALLSGLQDYANMQPGNGTEPDFSALFGDATGGSTGEATQQAGGQQEGDGDDGPRRDSTFDDLMDFSFDLGGDGDNHEEMTFEFT